MAVFDIAFICMNFIRSDVLDKAINEFVLDPRGKPDLESVFILQEITTVLVGFSVFFHLLFMIEIFSTLNAVYSK